MFIDNPNILNLDDMFYCECEDLKEYLCTQAKIPVLTQKVDLSNNKTYWYFAKSTKLTDALCDYGKVISSTCPN
jgi:hypothetical protein